MDNRPSAFEELSGVLGSSPPRSSSIRRNSNDGGRDNNMDTLSYDCWLFCAHTVGWEVVAWLYICSYALIPVGGFSLTLLLYAQPEEVSNGLSAYY